MPSQIVLPIGIDGISCVRYVPDESKTCFAVGTNGGKVRIFDCDLTGEPQCVYQRRWHKSIRGLAFFPSTPQLLLSVSRQSGIKIHDIETGQRSWMLLKAHGSTPISAVAVTGENQWATGDENGVLILWDKRQPGPGFTIKREDEENPVDDIFGGINDLCPDGADRKWLFAATDDGSLAVYNIRRRRLDMVSDTLGYSARAVAVVKNQKHVLVGTEEGVICQFNWGEYEAFAERFPLNSTARSSPYGTPAIERIAKVTENLIAVATDDGAISAINVLPNRYLGPIGRHVNPGRDEDSGGDCMDLSVSPNSDWLASGCPATRTVSFWPLAQWVEKSKPGVDKPSQKKAKRKTKSKLDPIQLEHLSGLLPDRSPSDSDEADSNDSYGEDSDQLDDTNASDSSDDD